MVSQSLSLFFIFHLSSFVKELSLAYCYCYTYENETDSASYMTYMTHVESTRLDVHSFAGMGQIKSHYVFLLLLVCLSVCLCVCLCVDLICHLHLSYHSSTPPL